MKNFFLVFLLSVSIASKAQFVINGYITDAQTGEVLIGANIYTFDKKIGAVTNTYGFYSITVNTKLDSLEFYISYIGYQTAIRKIKLEKDNPLDVKLEPKVELKEVVINAEKQNRIEESSQMSKIDLPVEQIKKIPAILGEVDVIKAIQLLPGVQKPSEGSTGLYIRGGSPDQNLILLDGVPVYNVSHLFGFFSVFNADALNNVQLYKGGFPARFGERLSSVLDINTKEGNNKQFGGSASIGVVASRLMLEGPISKSGNTTFMISGRRTYADALIRPFMKKSEWVGGYFFYDLNAKFSHRFSNKDRIFISAYSGKDKFYLNQEDQYVNAGTTYFSKNAFGLDWGNITGAFRWNHLYGKKLFSNTSITTSRYLTNFKIGLEERQTTNGNVYAEAVDLRYFSGITDIGGKMDFDYAPNPDHFVRFGVNLVNHFFQPGSLTLKFFQTGFQPLDTTIAPSRKVNSNEVALYIEDDFKVNEQLKVNYGLRFSNLFVDKVWYKYAEPRISARYFVSSDWAIKGSYALMHQYIQLLSNSGGGLPYEICAPSTKNIKPQESQQVAFGVAHTINDEIEFSVEGYYKYMKNINQYRNGAEILTIADNDWEKRIEQGTGQSYGMEVLIQKKSGGRLTGWVGYTLSKSTLRFTELNFGQPFPSRFDRRHDVSIVSFFKLTDKINVNVVWIYGTGNAITFPKGKYLDMNGIEIIEYGPRNGFRLPPTHRLDFGINRMYSTKWFKEMAIDFSLYNVYSRKNPYFAYIRDDFNGNQKAYYVSILPVVVPALSINVKF